MTLSVPARLHLCLRMCKCAGVAACARVFVSVVAHLSVPLCLRLSFLSLRLCAYACARVFACASFSALVSVSLVVCLLCVLTCAFALCLCLGLCACASVSVTLRWNLLYLCRSLGPFGCASLLCASAFASVSSGCRRTLCLYWGGCVILGGGPSYRQDFAGNSGRSSRRCGEEGA